MHYCREKKEQELISKFFADVRKFFTEDKRVSNLVSQYNDNDFTISGIEKIILSNEITDTEVTAKSCNLHINFVDSYSKESIIEHYRVGDIETSKCKMSNDHKYICGKIYGACKAWEYLDEYDVLANINELSNFDLYINFEKPFYKDYKKIKISKKDSMQTEQYLEIYLENGKIGQGILINYNDISFKGEFGFK